MGSNFSSEVSNNGRVDNLYFPPEILEVIINHLSTRDKLVARGVCHDWNSYIRTIGLEESIYIKLEHSEEQLEIIAKSPFAWIPCSNFHFRNINLKSSLFWIEYEDFITSLHFDDCTCLIGISKNSEISSDGEFRLGCPNLKHLGITNCNKYMMMGNSFFNVPKLLTLEKLESLDLSGNSYLNDSILFSLLLEIKSLKSLNLSNSPLAFIGAIFRRFYPGVQSPQTDLKKFSDNILTFQMLNLSFLSTPRGSQMRELNLSETRISQESLALISNPEHFTWEGIVLNRCFEINPVGLLAFVNMQLFITKLEIERMRLNNIDLATLKSTTLKKLVMKDCQSFTDMDFLSNIPQLEYLDISSSPMFGNKMIKYTPEILSCVPNLKVLKIQGVRLIQVIQEANIILDELRHDIIKLKWLTELDLGNSGNIVNDVFVQEIIQHLIQLKTLRLCKSLVTDEGMTGRLTDTQLPSRLPGVCLSRLENLRILSLSNCLDLDEGTWNVALKLPNLVSLDLAHCSQINREGICSILQNCANLEHLVLLDCEIRDDLLFSEIRNMPRMRHLVI